MKKKHLYLLLRLVISVGLIGYFLYLMSKKHGGLGEAFQQITSAFSGASVLLLTVAGLLHLVGFSLTSLRWKVLLKAQGAETSFRELFSYYFMAAFFNTFLPSTIGGDTVRAIESKKLTANTSTSVMVVIIERLTGLMALVLIAAVGLLIKISRSPGSQRTVWIFLAAVVTGFVVAIGCAHPRVAPRILRFLGKFLPGKIHGFLVQASEAAAIYYEKPASLLIALGISIIFQLNMVLYYFLIASSLHQHPDPVEFMMFVPIMVFLLMTVPAINGLGIRTAGFKEFLKFPEAYSLVMETIDLAFRIGYGLLGGLFFLLYRRKQE
ncbi:MAG: flippase-like domain-containing protein [bacterium]|nr:flippase-like domain-containing protein [bacterium]